MPDLDFSPLSDAQRRNLRRILEAIGCLVCPKLRISHGRNVNHYGCALGAVGCERAVNVREILRKAAAKHAAEVAH